MSMFRDTITVYNKYVEGGVEKWSRTILQGVFWDSRRGAVLRKNGAASADSAVILIPRSADLRGAYRKPMVWGAQEVKTGTWTLQEGHTVVRGAHDIEILKSITKELAGLDDVLAITIVDDKNFGGLAHWEVSAK
jgi:hypothetical protein